MKRLIVATLLAGSISLNFVLAVLADDRLVTDVGTLDKEFG